MGATPFGGVYVSNGPSFATAWDGLMISVWRNNDEIRGERAAAWVVRLEADGLGDVEAVTFDAWLSASPENTAAFDAAMAVSHSYTANCGQIARALSQRAVARPVVDRRYFVGGVGIAAAAMVALAVAPEVFAPTATTTYATTKGEKRSVTLADGSRVDLNAGTRLTVTLTRNERSVNLDQGQAVFDVTHDADRPFTVAAGDRTVRVVGTQFDVRRRDGKLSITVARGAVEVRPGEGGSGKSYRLRPGQRLDHIEGGPMASVVSTEPAEVLAWRTGRLVYRQQSLADVVADLNQQWTTPIRIEDPSLAAMPVSGVLILDSQDAVIRRLALLAPIRAVRSDAGLILRRDPASDR